MKLAELYTEIRVRDRGAKSSLKAYKRLADSASRAFDKVARAAKWASIAAGAFAAVAVRNFIKQEAAERKLAAVLKVTGNVAGFSAEQLKNRAKELQKMSTFSDAAIVDMQAMLATFLEIRGVNFDDATKAILDISNVMGQDLRSSVIQVGKALNDPILGLTALRRVGISFSKEQKDLVKSFMDVGDIAGAQGVILKELGREMGGAAAAARNSLGGALIALKNEATDLSEQIGKPLVQALVMGINWFKRFGITSADVTGIIRQFTDYLLVAVKFWVRVYAIGETAIKSWQNVAQVAFLAVQLSAVTFAEEALFQFERLRKAAKLALSDLKAASGALRRGNLKSAIGAAFIRGGVRAFKGGSGGGGPRTITAEEQRLTKAIKKLTDTLTNKAKDRTTELLKELGLVPGVPSKAKAAQNLFAKPDLPFEQARGTVAQQGDKAGAAAFMGLQDFAKQIQLAVIGAPDSPAVKVARKQLLTEQKTNEILVNIGETLENQNLAVVTPGQFPL